MIRTPFVRTGIPGGSSPLFRPAIYLLLTLAFYAALSAADRIWEIPHPHLFVIRLRRFTDAMLLALPDDDKAAAALEYIRNYPGITFEEVNG